MGENDHMLVKFARAVYYILDTPVTFVREKIIEPNQQKYPWYHQKFRRVPTIDECYTDDMVCQVEANLQYLRDKAVDDAILSILRSRFEECSLYHGIDAKDVCMPLLNAYEDATGAWFAKHGDLGTTANAKNVYMKQKHRLIWERTHGPVGTGMKA